MIKSLHYYLPVCVLIVNAGLAHADIYLDASRADEVTISNNQPVENSAEHAAVTVFKVPDSQSIVTPRHTKQSAALPYQQEVILAATETALDPALINAVIAAESSHNPKARSKKGAYGLMQLMPDTARRFNVKNKHNIQQNVSAGARYLKELMGLFNGDIQLALAAYNAGPAAVRKYNNQIPPYQETILYVPKVLKYYQNYAI